MADYYSSASFVVAMTAEQAAVAATILHLVQDEDHPDLLARRPSRALRQEYAPEVLSRARRIRRLLINNGDMELDYLALEFDFEPMTSEGATGLWVSDCGEHINGNKAATCIQELLRHFGLDHPVGFEVAYHCSKARLDAFGGCAFFITRKSIRWNSTMCWLEQQFQRLKARTSTTD
ncbi:hypothetical protein IC617_08500 [Neiella sp. HB171785]|uniref:Uncharacterized protein n=1 Tax=Neiella litorisoli TaxID=2771431 RepID=A0A8J6QH48_9GAMM|nr:hypothetical protein [Neiella litorisoli]MBD1389465.1 hypothetical protein [Neiella litorisoli]